VYGKKVPKAKKARQAEPVETLFLAAAHRRGILKLLDDDERRKGTWFSAGLFGALAEALL
jgi:hypothetical protein